MTATEKKNTDEFVEHYAKPENRKTYGWVKLTFEEYGGPVNRNDPRVQKLVEEAKRDYRDNA